MPSLVGGFLGQDGLLVDLPDQPRVTDGLSPHWSGDDTICNRNCGKIETTGHGPSAVDDRTDRRPTERVSRGRDSAGDA